MPTAARIPPLSAHFMTPAIGPWVRTYMNILIRGSVVDVFWRRAELRVPGLFKDHLGY